MFDSIEILIIVISVIAAVVIFTRILISFFRETMNTAYRESKLQGRLCKFVPLYAVYYAAKRQHSGLKRVITEFMEAGAASNVEAAYACWSAQSATKEEITKLIESNHDIFAGYKRLSIWG